MSLAHTTVRTSSSGALIFELRNQEGCDWFFPLNVIFIGGMIDSGLCSLHNIVGAFFGQLLFVGHMLGMVLLKS